MRTSTPHHLALYYFDSCPYCQRVLVLLPKWKTHVELRDVLAHENYAQELIDQGGLDQVPCLRITLENGAVQWLYESLDIIDYLEGLEEQARVSA